MTSPAHSRGPDAHARSQVYRLGEPLGHPQGVGPTADVGDEPVGVVRRRLAGIARK